MASKTININDASYDELISLPGIGPKTARAIHDCIDKYPFLRLSYEFFDMIDFTPPRHTSHLILIGIVWIE